MCSSDLYPFLESGRSVPSSYRNWILYLWFCLQLEYGALLPSVLYLYHSFNHELLHGDIMGDLWNAYPDYHYDMQYRRGCPVPGANPGCSTGRICIWRPLLSDVRYHNTRFHRFWLSAHKPCRDPAALCNPGGSPLCRRLSGSRTFSGLIEGKNYRRIVKITLDNLPNGNIISNYKNGKF